MWKKNYWLCNIMFKISFDKIRLVEIEIFSYCNRRCWFCPNSFIDRNSENILMDENVYLKMLNDLKSINFSGMISWSRYNEPLSHREVFLTRLKQTKELLTNATLHTNTNGDYLTKDYLDDIYDAGLRSLNIQCYLKEDEEFNTENIKQKIENMAHKLELKYFVTCDTFHRYEVEFEYKVRMNLKMYARDFRVDGNNRGGSLKIIESKIRNAPCFLPCTDIYIDYNGKVMPCCNFRSDIKEHQKFILGDVNANSILNIFNNKKAQNLRKILSRAKIEFHPCNECDFAIGHEYE